jgi:hypothetical protein
MIKNIYKNFLENWIPYGFQTLVVIIGILIALVLQNWNEARKESIQELKYLKRVQNDLAQDTAYFNNSVNLCKELVKKNQNAWRVAYDEQKTLEQFRYFLNQIDTYSIPFQIQNATYIDLINTGNINIFRNGALKIEIIQYYRECEFIEKDVDDLKDFSSQLLINAFSKGVSFGKYQELNSSLLLPSMINPKDWAYMDDYNSLEFKALNESIQFTYVKNLFFISDFARLNKSAQNLLLQIDKELKMRE